jgi:hypothetical protein
LKIIRYGSGQMIMWGLPGSYHLFSRITCLVARDKSRMVKASGRSGHRV